MFVPRGIAVAESSLYFWSTLCTNSYRYTQFVSDFKLGIFIFPARMFQHHISYNYNSTLTLSTLRQDFVNQSWRTHKSPLNLIMIVVDY